MAKAQHRTAEYRAAKRDLRLLVQAGEAWCVEPRCLMPSRWIEPDTTWDVCHTPDGLTITGAGHSKCNRSEGATRGNKARNRVRQWIL